MTESQKWMLLSLLVLSGWLIYLLSPILTPFLVAATLGYIGDPLVDRIEAHKISRNLAVTIVFLLFTLILVLCLLVLIPLLEDQIMSLTRKIPGFIDYLQETILPEIERMLGLKEHQSDLTALKEALQQNWQSVGGLAGYLVDTISKSSMLLVAWISNLVLIPVIAFYLMRDWDILIDKINHLLPRHIEPVISELALESDEVLGSFLRGQMSVMLSLAAIYSIGLWIAGLDFALQVGMLAGAVSFVTYLGFIVGILAAIIASLIQYHDFMHLLPVMLVFGIGQLIESMILTPLLVGDRIGLHPVAVIFAIMAGGQLFGFVGVLIALPVAAVVMVLLRHIYQRYVASQLYTKTVDESYESD